MTRETHNQILRESIHNHILKMGYGNVQDAIDRLIEPKTLDQQVLAYGMTNLPAGLHDDKDLIVRNKDVRTIIDTLHQLVLEAFRA